MDVNERIARALGWEIGVHGHWKSPDGRYDLAFPDYAHSLDACLPVLAELRAKGWFWAIDQFYDRRYVATIGNWNTTGNFEAVADSPAAALAECLADALEAEKSPD